ncbi:MAG: hypothetical protein M3527_10470 [Actinomycetota bacterium]|nr:hypothetical protein [Acidimicrobiia bacterium]MDQ3294852.1 hypothetical protein [Actinomycetota bacterium]
MDGRHDHGSAICAELDRLDLELRSVPGVVAVGIEGVDGGQLVVQVVALASLASHDLSERVNKAVSICQQLVTLELVVEAFQASRRRRPPHKPR